MAFSAVVAPLLAWVGLRIMRVPRAFLVAVVGVLLGHLFADLAKQVQLIRFDFDYGAPLAPGGVHVLLGALAGVVSLLVVGRGPQRGFVRLGALGLVVALSWGSYSRVSHLEAEHREAELAAVEVTPYLPAIDDRATPTYASTRRETIRISYDYAEPPGGQYDFPEVVLVPAAGRDPCVDAEAAGYYPGFDESTCTLTADGFVADDGHQHHVGVVRGETTRSTYERLSEL